MLETTTNPAPVIADASKRRRNEPVILTNRHCEKRVAKRTKIYDRKCAGLYVSITTAGVGTFYLQVTDRFTGKARCKWLGIYNPTTFNVDHARTEVYALKVRIGTGENVFVWFSRFAEPATLKAHRDALARCSHWHTTLRPSLLAMLTGEPQQLTLAPTPRSLLR